MKNQKSHTKSPHFIVTFSDGFDHLDKAQLKSINQICKNEFMTGDFKSIKQVEVISEQKENIDQFYFELTQETRILKSLVATVYSLDVNSKEYVDCLNTISYFIRTNIIDKSKELIGDLTFALDVEG